MKFDTHIHTRHSLCSNMKPRDVVDQAAEAGLDEIVIKDYNEIEGAIEAEEYALTSDYRDIIKVHLGIEPSTEFGEIGMSFLSRNECQRLMEARNDKGTFDFGTLIELDHEFKQGSSQMMKDLHHPFDFANPKRGFDFDRALDSGILYSASGLMRFFDFMEMNTASTDIRETQDALALAADFDKPIVCSSDSHFLKQVGRYFTETRHHSAREAIENNDLTHSVTPEEIEYFRSRMYRIASWCLKRGRKMF